MKKHLIVAALVTCCLTATLLAAMPYTRSQSGGYDPWTDINGDGSIDMADVSMTIDGFMTAGDSTKNVNVTNWAVQSPATFPRELILRGTMFLHSNLEEGTPAVYRRDLIAEDTPYLPKAGPQSGGRYDNESATKTLLEMGLMDVYNETFTYQKVPTKAYQITGLPTVSLTYNVTNCTKLTGNIVAAFIVSLGTVDSTGKWTTQYDFPTRLAMFMNSNYVDYQSVVVLAPYDPNTLEPTPLSITVNTGDRLAIRVRLIAELFMSGDNCDVTFNILFGKGTDEFLADIPIVETS